MHSLDFIALLILAINFWLLHPSKIGIEHNYLNDETISLRLTGVS